jgi:hypothetical protein
MLKIFAKFLATKQGPSAEKTDAEEHMLCTPSVPKYLSFSLPDKQL